MRVRIAQVAGVSMLAASLAGAAERGAATASIGGKAVTIEHGRPSLGGRSLDALLKQLPEDRVWRAGENQVTTLTTAGPLKVGGRKLPAGKYSLYVHLGADGTRTLLVNSDLGVPLVKIWAQAPPNLANEPWPRLDGYTKNVAAKEVLRVPLKKDATPAPVDPFAIAFTPAGAGATLKLSWGSESWSVDVQPGD
jgi:hypothetical protein